MGMSPDAMIFYGIAYEEDEVPEDFGDRAYDYEIEQKNKFCPEPTDESDIGAEVWEKWRVKAAKWEKGSCNYGYRGYCDSGSPYVCIKVSRLRVEWDETAEVNMDQSKEGEWDKKLEEYCLALGIPFRKPKWLLAAYYG